MQYSPICSKLPTETMHPTGNNRYYKDYDEYKVDNIKILPQINTSKGVITCTVKKISSVSCCSLCRQTLRTEISRVMLALNMLRDYELSVE